VKRVTRVIWLFAVVACASCGSLLAGKKPKYQYYVLAPERSGPRSDRVEVAGRDGDGDGDDDGDEAQVDRIAVVGRVNFPDYLDREAIVTRIDEHRLSYAGRDRWAEPLPEAFTRMFTQDLRAAVAPAGIVVQAGKIGALPDLDVRIDVLRFERTSSDRVELWARWTVHAGGKLVHSGESRLRERTAGPSSGQGAAALSRSIGRLADEIGDALVTLSSPADRSDRPDRDPRSGTARPSSPRAPTRR
jgi:uncharacterized lipoprotein YmbA